MIRTKLKHFFAFMWFMIDLQYSKATDGGTANGVMGGIMPPGPIDPGTPNVETTLLTMDYCGNHIYRNGVLERTMNDYGYQVDSTYYIKGTVLLM